MDDAAAMQIALAEASAAFHEGEVPVGAVLVMDGVVVARDHNRVEALASPAAHAEMLVLGALPGEVRRNLGSATLYVTLEPCLMCAGAILLNRVGRVVYGCDDPKSGAVRSLFAVLTDPRLNHRCQVVPGVQAEASAGMLKRFFEALRSAKGDRHRRDANDPER